MFIQLAYVLDAYSFVFMWRRSTMQRYYEYTLFPDSGERESAGVTYYGLFYNSVRGQYTHTNAGNNTDNMMVSLSFVRACLTPGGVHCIHGPSCQGSIRPRSLAPVHSYMIWYNSAKHYCSPPVSTSRTIHPSLSNYISGVST